MRRRLLASAALVGSFVLLLSPPADGAPSALQPAAVAGSRELPPSRLPSVVALLAERGAARSR